jgi:phosphatidylglycerol:prolipoprotein diacylglycerol transferase
MALARFSIEFFREPDADKGFIAFGWLTMGQLLSTPLIFLGIVVISIGNTNTTPSPQPSPKGQGPE